MQERAENKEPSKEISKRTDEELLLAFSRSGPDSRGCIEELVRRYQPVFRSYLTSFLGPTDAEDVLQSFFLKLLEHPQRTGAAIRAKAWLWRVLMNSAKDFLRSSYTRRSKKFLQLLVDIDIEHPKDLVSELLFEERRLLVRKKCEDLLPKRTVKILFLRMDEQLTEHQIAERLKMPLYGVKNRIHYAMLKLHRSPEFASLL